MENHIYILDDIGTGGVTKSFVESQYDPKAERVVVHINSNGGEVDEGMAIRDFLMEIPQPVHTIGEGMVASIATMAFLAGETREMKPNSQFLAHLPSLGGFEGNSDDFERASQYMQDIRRRIASIYSQYSGKSTQEMEDFMRLDKPVFANVAKEMGFATYVPEFKAVAKLNVNKYMAETKEPSKLDTIHDGLMKALNELAESLEPNNEVEPQNEVVQPENIDVELADGGMLFVESEDGEFVGKMVYLTDEEGNRTDQVAPEGTHQLVDGRSIVVDGEGMITEVTEASEDEPDARDKEIEDLKAQLEAKNQEIDNFKAENDKKIEALDKKVSELTNLAKMTVGGEPKVQVANIKPKSSEQPAKAHQLDGLASKLNRR